MSKLWENVQKVLGVLLFLGGVALWPAVIWQFFGAPAWLIVIIFLLACVGTGGTYVFMARSKSDFLGAALMLLIPVISVPVAVYALSKITLTGKGF